MSTKVKVRVRAPVSNPQFNIVKDKVYSAFIEEDSTSNKSVFVTSVSIPELDIKYALTDEGDTKEVDGCAHLDDKYLWELIRD